MKPLSRQAATATLFTILLLPLIASVVEAQENLEIQQTTIRIYRDGTAHITQTLSVDELYAEINIPLLSESVENLIILDENQLAVDFQLKTTNLTILTLGASQISIEYDTVALTNKQAEVWTLLLNSPYNLTLSLPQNSTIIYLNQVPNIIDTANNELSLSLNSNQWEISYILPLQEDNQNFSAGFPIEYLIVIAILVTTATIIAFLFFMRKRRINIKKIINNNSNLAKDDIAVIEFLAQKEGKAFESEIRKQFPDMPRTSLWRLVRRLEGLEIVEIKRIGLENQVQLTKK
jgi:uncharacterized membrane protein